MPYSSYTEHLIAQPAQPQQLFVLATYQGTADSELHLLGQKLATHFVHGLVVGIQIAVPQSASDARPTSPHLLPAIAQWQERSGLSASCTALICYGNLATEALSAWAHQPAFCARLFAIYAAGSAPHLPVPDTNWVAQAHDDTCIYCLCGNQPPAIMQQLEHTVHAWQALNKPDGLALDFSLDILPELTSPPHTTQTDIHIHAHTAVQERVLWLLQNHVPQKLWRAALAAAQQQP